jgi:hypothetical protein
MPLGLFIIEACASFAAYALGAAPGARARCAALALALLPAAALDAAGGCKFALPIRRGLGFGACLWRLPPLALVAARLVLDVLLPHGILFLCGDWLAAHPNLEVTRWVDCMRHSRTRGRRPLGTALLLLAAATPGLLRVPYMAVLHGMAGLLLVSLLVKGAASGVVGFMHKAHRTLRPVSEGVLTATIVPGPPRLTPSPLPF